jgi:hypothetical protein
MATFTKRQRRTHRLAQNQMNQMGYGCASDAFSVQAAKLKTD